jgi:hypothetical protein
MLRNWLEQRRRRVFAQTMTKAMPDAFGRYFELLEKYSPDIVDESWLPVSKEALKMMFMAAVATDRDETRRDWLISSWLMLSHFQPGIGETPFPMVPPELPPDFEDGGQTAYMQTFGRWRDVWEKTNSETDFHKREIDELMKSLG